jgi:hypothetical protein
MDKLKVSKGRKLPPATFERDRNRQKRKCWTTAWCGLGQLTIHFHRALRLFEPLTSRAFDVCIGRRGEITRRIYTTMSSNQYATKAVPPPVFEVRALPRKRKPVEEEQPLFLRKVFSMIGSCPPAVGGWSSHGETFVIKDADKFAEEIIPTAFKHSKFSSFVRQLNFYGFRKVRPDAVSQAHWWEFRHPYFKRDEPELIAKIKKSVHFDAQGQPVVREGANAASEGNANDSVAAEMEMMKSKMGAMEARITELTQLVHTLIAANKGTVAATEPATNSKKKRKVSVSSHQEVAVDSSPVFTIQRPEETMTDSDSENSDSWEDMLKSKFFNDNSNFEWTDMAMTPMATGDLFDEMGPFEDMTIDSNGAVSTVAEAFPVANASLLNAHPLSDPAAMVGMVDLMARTLGTVATMCHTNQQQQQQLAVQQQVPCQCANCKVLTNTHSSSAAEGHVQVPTVMSTLLAASLGAFAVKYGDSIFSNRNTPAPATQETH